LWSLKTVVLGEGESADGCPVIDSGVGPVPVVSVQPGGQLIFSLARVFIGTSIGPFAQAGLDEALSLAIGLRGIGFGADVAQIETFAGPSEGEGLVARAIVGHYALGLDTEAGVIGDRCLEKGDRAALLLVRHDLREGDAGVIVDADVHVFPADAALITLASAVAGDAVSDLIELTELFDVDVDQLAGMLALIAPHRLGGLERGEPIEPEPPQDAAYGSGRDRELASDLGPSVALSAQNLDGIACGLGSLAGR
jgi:hypothetical protein